MLLMTGAATLAVGASIVIPLITRSVVDGPHPGRRPRRAHPAWSAGPGARCARGGLVFIRRWVQSYAALGMETAVRDDLYAHLQRLPVAFHDRWQTGQLLSRATSDLSTIRRFLSFGLVYLVVNLATFITVVALLVHIYPPLAALVAASSVPLLFISRNLSRAYLTVSRRVQDLQGDLATFVEESAVGVRVIRSFGRREHVGRAFRRGGPHPARLGGGQGHASWRASGRCSTSIPSLTLGGVLLFGSLAVSRDAMSLGDLFAFVSLMLMLVWPIDSLGWILANGQEAMTAADRIYEVFDTEPSIVDRPGAVAVASTDGRLALRARRLHLRGCQCRAGAARHQPRGRRPARRWRSWA